MKNIVIFESTLYWKYSVNILKGFSPNNILAVGSDDEKISIQTIELKLAILAGKFFYL